jgi:hypothetical protein
MLDKLVIKNNLELIKPKYGVNIRDKSPRAKN